MPLFRYSHIYLHYLQYSHSRINPIHRKVSIMAKILTDDLQYRSKRLQTFNEGVKIGNAKSAKQWTQKSVNVNHLADLGFYYSPARNLPHQVTCFWCGKKEKNLENVASVAEFHLANSPECPYAMISSTLEKFIMDSEKETFWQRLTENHRENRLPTSILHPHSITSCLLRQLTFKNLWKFDKMRKSKVTSRGLAKAGFYYSPLDPDSDRVICMYCDCPLEEWDASDDPLEEHKHNSFTYCYFLETLGVKLPKLPKLPKVKPEKKVEEITEEDSITEALKEISEDAEKSLKDQPLIDSNQVNVIEPDHDFHSASLDSPMNLGIRHQDMATPSPNILQKATTPSDFDAFDFSVEDLENHDMGTIFNDKKLEDKKSLRRYQRRRDVESQVQEKQKFPDTGMSLVLEIKAPLDEEDSESIQEADDLTYIHDAMVSGSLKDNSTQREESKVSAYSDSVVHSSFREDISDVSSETSTNAGPKKPAKTQKKRKSNLLSGLVPKRQKPLLSSDELGLNQEQLEEILNSPRKGRKMKVLSANKGVSPPHDIYDLSNQNIGDYEEENISFLEKNVRPGNAKKGNHDTEALKMAKETSGEASIHKSREKKKGKKSLQLQLDDMVREDSRTFDNLRHKLTKAGPQKLPQASVANNILGDYSVSEISANFPSTSTPTKEITSVHLDTVVHEQEEVDEIILDDARDSEAQTKEIHTREENKSEKEAVYSHQEKPGANIGANDTETERHGALEIDKDDNNESSIETLEKGDHTEVKDEHKRKENNDPMEVEMEIEKDDGTGLEQEAEFEQAEFSNGINHSISGKTHPDSSPSSESIASIEKDAIENNFTSVEIADSTSSESKHSPDIEESAIKAPIQQSLPRASAFDSDSFEIPHLSSDREEAQTELDIVILPARTEATVEAQDENTLTLEEIQQDAKDVTTVQEESMAAAVEVSEAVRNVTLPLEEMEREADANGNNCDAKEELVNDVEIEEIEDGEAVFIEEDVEGINREDDSKKDIRSPKTEKVAESSDLKEAFLEKMEVDQTKIENDEDKDKEIEDGTIEVEKIEHEKIDENIENEMIDDEKIEEEMIEDEKIEVENEKGEEINEKKFEEEKMDEVKSEKADGEAKLTEDIEIEDVNDKQYIQDDRIEKGVEDQTESRTIECEVEVEIESQTKLEKGHDKANQDIVLEDDKQAKAADSTLNLDEPSELKELNLSPSSYQEYVNDMKDMENELIEENEIPAKQDQIPSFVEDSASDLLALSTQSPVKEGSPEIGGVSEAKVMSERNLSTYTDIDKDRLNPQLLSSDVEYQDSTPGEYKETKIELNVYSDVEKSPSPPSYVVGERRFPISSPRKLASSVGDLDDQDFSHSMLKRLSFTDIEASTPQNKIAPKNDANMSDSTTATSDLINTDSGRVDFHANEGFNGSGSGHLVPRQLRNDRLSQRTKISPVKLDNVAMEIQTLLDTIEYLAEVSATQRELHNDAEGILTQFIAAMPEEEEGMSIREWINHNATACGRTVREISERMVKAYEKAFDLVIENVEQMDTVD